MINSEIMPKPHTHTQTPPYTHTPSIKPVSTMHPFQATKHHSTKPLPPTAPLYFYKLQIKINLWPGCHCVWVKGCRWVGHGSIFFYFCFTFPELTWKPVCIMWITAWINYHFSILSKGFLTIFKTSLRPDRRINKLWSKHPKLYMDLSLTLTSGALDFVHCLPQASYSTSDLASSDLSGLGPLLPRSWGLSLLQQ